MKSVQMESYESNLNVVHVAVHLAVRGEAAVE